MRGFNNKSRLLCRKSIALFLCGILLFSFVSCSRVDSVDFDEDVEMSTENETSSVEETSESVVSEASLIETVPSSILENYSINGIEIDVNAVIIAPENIEYSVVNLRTDEDVALSFPYNTDNARFSCFSGYIDYTDSSVDSECISLDDDAHMFEANYITPFVPNNMTRSALDACDDFSSFVSRFTVFDVEPYTVLANDNVNSDETGFYQIEARLVYDGVPVSNAFYFDENEMTFGRIGARAKYNEDGIFQFQGHVGYSVADSVPTSEIVNYDVVLESFANDIVNNIDGTLVEVHSIELIYMPILDGDSLNLYLAWCVNYYDIRNEAGNIIPIEYSFFYSAESGEFLARW